MCTVATNKDKRSCIDSLRIWSTTLTPVVALVILTLIAAALTINIVNCEQATALSIATPACVPHVPNISANFSAIPFAELSGRLSWAISVLFVGLTTLLTFGAVFIALGKIEHQRPRFALWIITAAAIPLFILYAAWSPPYSFNDRFLSDTVYKLGSVKDFVSLVEGLGRGALFALAIAVASVLYRASSATRNPHSSEINELASCHTTLQSLLFLGASALVAGTLESTALYAWANSMFDKSAYIASNDDIAATMGMLTGSFYSILLAAVFIPGFVLLRHLADLLAARVVPDKTVIQRAQWLVDNGVDVSVVKKAISAFAVLAPFITGGPLIQLLDLITK